MRFSRLLALSLAVTLSAGNMPLMFAAARGTSLYNPATSAAPSQDAQLQLQAAPPSQAAAQAPATPSYSPSDAPLRGRLSTIPRGTVMMVKMEHPVSSTSCKVGDTVSAIVESDVYSDNQIAVPVGSTIEGQVTSVTPAGHLSKSGSMEIQFITVKTTYGNVYPFRGHLVTADNTGILHGDSQQAQVLKSAGVIAVGAGGGTLAGCAAGSLIGAAGSGALFGLGVGALAGMGYAVVREGKNVVIPSGARLSIIVDQPVSIN